MYLNFILVPLLIFLESNGLGWLFFFSLYHTHTHKPHKSHFKQADLHKIPLWRAHSGYSINACWTVKSTVLVYKLNIVKVIYTLYVGVNKFIFDSPFACDEQVILCVFLLSWYLPDVLFLMEIWKNILHGISPQFTKVICMLWMRKKNKTVFSI